MTDCKASPRSPFDDEDADIVFRSADGVDFRLYKVIVAKASSVFRDMLTLPDTHPPGEPQVVPLSEDADTLEGLLRFSYPVKRPEFKSLDKLGPVLTAAKKYGMPTVLDDLLRCLEPFLHTAPPLQVYLLACACELPKFVRQAARLLLDDPHYLDPYPMPAQFRTLPCEVMYVFAVYRRKCLDAAMAVVDDREWLLSGDHSHRMVYSNKGNPHLYSTWAWLGCEDGTCAADKTQGIWAARKSGGQTLYPRLWCRYIARVRRSLTRRPNGKVIIDQASVEQAVTEAVRSCSACGPKAREHMADFSRALKKRIDADLETVCACSPDLHNLATVTGMRYLAFRFG
ncbi:hypothetical protein C8Q76DRAFT_44693 [Earliella scabrosa]|nr:hypothetical protein C8Q76DRAFT_44693 [Earliella scabrosa]